MVSALGEAAKKPAPAAVATATSTGTAKTESDLRNSEQPPVQSAPATVVEVHGAPAQPAPVVVTPRTLVKPADGCLAARKPAVRRGHGLQAARGRACLPEDGTAAQPRFARPGRGRLSPASAGAP